MPPFAARPLDPFDYAEARDLVARIGVHGVYVGNYLARASTPTDGGELLGFYGADRLLGLAFFGDRGNLIEIEEEPLDPDRVAGAIRDSGWAWRIVLAPASVVAALTAMERREPLVRRRQLYYGVEPEAVPADRVRVDVRPAIRKDHARLLQAALDLNEVDLHVDPRRVHKQWLRESIRRRVRGGQTYVIGEPGALQCKLDVGSHGPCGLMVEGVYTFPEARSSGLATGLVASVAFSARGLQPLVSLHVAADNAPARRAYERAGMQVMAECELMLRV